MSGTLREYTSKSMAETNPAAGPAALGIFLTAAALFLAFFLTGAGHGWGAPFLVSMPLLAVLPIALVRSRTGKRTGMAWDIGLVFLAVAADYYLIGNAIGFRESAGRVPGEFLVPGVHRSVFPMFLLWLGIWLFWQWLAIRTLMRHFLQRAPWASRP